MKFPSRLAFACIALGGVSALALAQEPADPAPAAPAFEPEFDREPGPRIWQSNFPSDAMRAGFGGVVLLCCTPNSERRLDCNILLEAPEGEDFGRAARSISRAYRLTEASYAAFQARGEQHIAMPFKFEVSGGGNTERVRTLYEQVEREGATMCAHPELLETVG